jgi:hypothetical protein
MNNNWTAPPRSPPLSTEQEIARLEDAAARRLEEGLTLLREAVVRGERVRLGVSLLTAARSM